MCAQLFTPLRLGPRTVRNRLVFTAHLTNFAVDGLPTEQHAAYYAARAAGGAGLIVTEEHTIHPSDRADEKLIRGYDRAAIAGGQRITSSVHAHGSVILAQLNHNGGQGSSRYSRRPIWAPSSEPDPYFRETPVAVDDGRIQELIDGYARAAGYCREAGYDGVELQASQSSIIRQFLSGATNRRAEGWGGSVAARARFLLAVVDAVRSALGPDHVLGVRLGGDEFLPGGVVLAEAVEVAGLVEASGQVDYLSTAIGVATSSMDLIAPGPRVPAGYAGYIPAAIRAAVSLPVIGVGRFKTPEQAERALAAGECDLVGVMRGQIADPDFGVKAATGRGAEIRACLSCNQECAGRVGLNRSIGCLENPRAGVESVARPRRRPARRVVVVGGGPAGLRAAATAAARGHEVTLYERSAETGGQVRLAARGPSRAEFGRLIDNLRREADQAGVRVVTGVEVDAGFLWAEAPAAVVLATGSRPHRPLWAGATPGVVDVRAVLGGSVRPSGSVVVVDELGFHPATSVAELLAERGCAVEIVTPALVVGQDLGLTLDRRLWAIRAAELGIALRTDVVVLAARAAGHGVALALRHHPTGAVLELRADWVVGAVAARADDVLWRTLRAGGPLPFEVHRIGDCLAPRRADAAVREGDRVGASL